MVGLVEIRNSKVRHETHNLDRLGPVICVIPYVMYVTCSLIDCVIVGGGPCPPYIAQGQGYKSVDT
jgi:hypothetical protein